MNKAESYHFSTENIAKSKFSPGDLVFAKMKGYPTWPAKISSVESEKPTCIRYSVYFFGTGNSAVCAEKNIFPYAETKGKYAKPMKYKGFQQALNEIEEAASFLEQEENGSLMNGVETKEEEPPVNESLDPGEDPLPGPSREGNDEQEDDQPQEVDHLKHQEQVTRVNGKIRKREKEEENFSAGEFSYKNTKIKIKKKDDQPQEVDPLMHHEEKPCAYKKITKTEKEEDNFSEEKFSYKSMKVKIKKEEPPGDESLVPAEDPLAGPSWEGSEEQDSTNHRRYPEDQDSIPETQELMSVSGSKGHSVHNNSEEAYMADGKLLRGCMNDGERTPQESCRAAGASSSCSEKGLKENYGKEKEGLREKGSGAARQFKAQNKEKVSVRKCLSEHSGRQKRNRGPLRCDTCRKCFRFKSLLEIHKRHHTDEKPFCCALCNKTFFSKGNLVRHFRVHNVEAHFKCSTCDKSFKTGSNLTRHMRVHSGEKPFVCRECGKAFNHSGTLKRHMWQHKEKYPFLCTKCGKAFSQNACLSAHMQNHRGTERFICNECGRAFGKKSNLARHMGVHSGESPFSCKDCGKSFTRSNYLMYHRGLLHSGASCII